MEKLWPEVLVEPINPLSKMEKITSTIRIIKKHVINHLNG